MSETSTALSERELEVLKLVATGATNQQIARDLVISPNTVKVHLRNIFEKLGVQSRTEATMQAVRRGWVSVPGMEGESTRPLPEAPVDATWAMLPVPRWQPFYMVVAASLVLLSLVFPFWWRARGGTAHILPMTDLGQPQTGPVLRQQASRWSTGAPAMQPLSRFAWVAGIERLYAIGGEDGNGVSDRMYVYDPVSDVWTTGSRKPTPVANVAGVLLGSQIFVPGGTIAGGGSTDILEIYDLPTEQWKVGAPMPAPLAAYALAPLHNKLYLFGGWDGQKYRAETWIYDPETDSWSSGAPMSRPRGFAAAAPLGEEIYVVGGYDGTRELATVAAYDPRGEGTDPGPWSARANLSQGRGGHAVTVVRSTLYVVGGGWTEPLAFNEQYDAPTGAWARIGTPILGEWRNLGLAAQGQKLYAVGGWSGSYLAVNEQYLALVRQLLPFGAKGN